VSPKNLIEAFEQRASNCACIAFIKAMLLQFGMRRSFSISKKKKYLVIRLRNQEKVLLSVGDIARVNKKNLIRFHRTLSAAKLKKLKTFVETSFAILVRQMQLKGFSGKQYTEDKAIKVLTKKGIDTAYFHELIGIRRTPSQRLTLKSFRSLEKKKAVFLLNDRHISICSRGWYEDFGIAKRLDKEIPVLLHRKIKYWYEIK
jgi:hypothetical protein